MFDNNEQNNHTQQMHQAVDFFQHPDRLRLLEAIYHKYIALGHIGGTVTLKETTYTERREIASFLNRTLPTQPDITIRLIDFQRALTNSRFACDLPDLLIALFPERSHITNPQRREQRQQSHTHFLTAITTIKQQTNSDHGQHWLTHGQHGEAYLFRQYKNASPNEQKQLLTALSLVLQALDNLPQPPDYERLAPFATRISGDPHYFDPGTLAGRLFYHALRDLSSLDQRLPDSPQDTEPETTSYPITSDCTQRLLLYYDAGLLLDTISSTIAVYNLATALDTDQQPDPLLTQAHQRLLILPLHQLLRWCRLTAASQDIYIFENPQVFEEVIDALQHSRNAHPTVICTSGWPSAAAMHLLNLLQKTDASLRYHYSGDFDIPGLRIADYLQRRYPTNLHLWHFTPTAYLSALHRQNQTLTPSEIDSLHNLPTAFAPLAAAMIKHKQRAYQESILPMLIKDILANSISTL